MNDLFRFVTLRPAKTTEPNTTNKIIASKELANILNKQQSIKDRTKELVRYRSSTSFHGNINEYHYGTDMEKFGTWAKTAELSTETVKQKLKDITGTDAESLAKTPKFVTDIANLSDTLLCLKYLSSAQGVDVNSLSLVWIGYDIVEQLSQKNELKLRHHIYEYVKPLVTNEHLSSQLNQKTRKNSEEIDKKIEKITQAQNALTKAMRTGFIVDPTSHSCEVQLSALKAELLREAKNKPNTPQLKVTNSLSTPQTSNQWQLHSSVIDNFSSEVFETIMHYAGDPKSASATALSQRLYEAKTIALTDKAKGDFVMKSGLKQIGSQWYTNPIFVGGLGKIDIPLPVGNIKPVGVGDLLLVRQHIKSYEGGEVGHIENVLRTEKMSRDTRRLDRIEQTTTLETETDKEEERDTQSTDRFSLKRETADTIKTDAQVKAGVSVDAKYGPVVEVKANLEGSYQQQTESVTKQASEFSRDVVSRSVSKLVTKIHQLQTTITLEEFEEKYGHGFDNTTGNTNVSGVYQFVDKVSEAQIYNYGKRLMFDVIVPEPAAFYIWAQQKNTAETTHLEPPVPFTITPSTLDEGNYQIYAQEYGATSIDPPPPLHKTISQAWDVIVSDDPHIFTKSGTVTIDDGYAAIWASAAAWWNYNDDDSPNIEVFVGSQVIDISGPAAPISLSSEEGSLSVGVFASPINALTATVEILCERTNRAWQVWQEKTYAAIQQAYIQKLQEYQRGFTELQTAQAIAVGGRNPEANTSVINAELRKSCIEQLTAQHFDSFGAIGSDLSGRPELNLSQTSSQGPYIRFFEEAFEWEHIVYFFYPYFWANKDTWSQRSLLDDSDDPNFADFLRSGAARVVFPVRPGFEKAIIHYLETGLIWDGGDPPDISSSLYVPIVDEIAEAEQRPGNEVTVGDPWEVRVPTQLVKLRSDDSLPFWKKVGDTWEPGN